MSGALIYIGALCQHPSSRLAPSPFSYLPIRPLPLPSPLPSSSLSLHAAKRPKPIHGVWGSAVSPRCPKNARPLEIIILREREGQGADTTEENRSHHKREKTELTRDVMRMDDNRLPRQAVHWDICGTQRKPGTGRPRKNWRDTTQQDLKSNGMTWEVAQQLAVNREGWRRRVFDTG